MSASTSTATTTVAASAAAPAAAPSGWDHAAHNPRHMTAQLAFDRAIACDVSARGDLLALVQNGALRLVSCPTTTQLLLPHDDAVYAAERLLCTTGVRCASPLPQWMRKLSELEERGAASVVLLAATALSLGLANGAATSAAWLRFWTLPVGPRIGAHALSVQVRTHGPTLPSRPRASLHCYTKPDTPTLLCSLVCRAGSTRD